MKDFAEKSGAIYQLRLALGRILLEFQDDLKALESKGLPKIVCDEVVLVLQGATLLFKERSTGGVTCVYAEIGRHFKRYADVYVEWNGPQGSDPGMQGLRRKKLQGLSERRRDLFRKLSQRQKELFDSGQVDLPFAESVRTPLAKLAEDHPETFPRLRQATTLFG